MTIDSLPATLRLEAELNVKNLFLTWKKDGEPLRMTRRHQYDVKETVHALVVNEVEAEDAGEYVASVSDVSSKASVVVECPPCLHLASDMKTDITLKTGQSHVVEIPFTAAPRPVVRWSFNNGPITSEAASTETIYGFTCLRLRKVTRADSGSYEAVVENELGKVNITINVKVLDKPSAPREVHGVLREDTGQVLVEWNPPKDDGGCPITSYAIEKREASKRSWQPVGQMKGSPHELVGISPGSTYFFRVFAINACGYSEPGEGDKPLVVPRKFEPPSQMQAPKVGTVRTTGLTLTWTPPDRDGGTPITAYHVEKKLTDGQWTPVTGRQGCPSTWLDVTSLEEGQDVSFRVCAENQASLRGEWSLPTKPVQTKTSYSKWNTSTYH